VIEGLYWKTKKKRTSIKRIKTKLKNKDWNWKTKNEKDNDIFYLLANKKEKKNNYHKLSGATPCGRRYNHASRKTIKDQI